MKALIYILISFISLNVYAQDVKVAGFGSMSELPNISTNDKHFAHFEFSHFSKDTNIEIVLWSFTGTKSPQKKIIVQENLLVKENPRIDFFVDNEKGSINLSCIYIGKYISKSPLKKNITISPYSFASKPKIKNKIVPIILFVEKDAPIDSSLLKEILDIQNLDFDKDFDLYKKLFSQSHNVEILTYQLKEL